MAGQNKRAVTSYNVAKAAGVSQSAVSRAFTEGAKISPATKEKVRKSPPSWAIVRALSPSR